MRWARCLPALIVLFVFWLIGIQDARSRRVSLSCARRVIEIYQVTELITSIHDIKPGPKSTFLLCTLGVITEWGVWMAAKLTPRLSTPCAPPVP